MNMETCSFELAQKLQKAGVKQDSVWYWVENPVYDPNPFGAKLGLAIGGGCWLFETDFYTGTVVTNGGHYSAFTASELSVMLPINKCNIRFCDQAHHGFQMYEDSWEVTFRGRSIVSVSETLANALGNMVLILTKEELI